jgi:polyhydroxyalkanoate synthase
MTSKDYADIFGAILQHMQQYNRGVMQASEYAKSVGNIDVGTTPADVAHQGRILRLLHYKPMVEKTHPVPLLVVYALINKYYVLDLQPDKSWVRGMLKQGFDIYMIDWGVPEPIDRYISFDDYVNRYIDYFVDLVRDRTGQEKISLHGYCMGGSMSAMYASLHGEKVKNLYVTAPVIDVEKDTTVLGNLSKHIDADLLVDNFGNIPPEFMYLCYNILKPFKQGVRKYIDFANKTYDKDFVENFLRVEKWLYDTPPIAGETFRQWIKDIYQKNALVKNQLKLGDKVIDLRKIDMPLLNVVADDDHLVSPECSVPLNYTVSSEDKELKVYSTGHIGLLASDFSQQQIIPEVAAWLKERSYNHAK